MACAARFAREIHLPDSSRLKRGVQFCDLSSSQFSRARVAGKTADRGGAAISFPQVPMLEGDVVTAIAA
jgi:hypothetical protein